MTHRRILLLGLPIAVGSFVLGCDRDSLECGEGTVEVDGMCVAGGGTGAADESDDGDGGGTAGGEDDDGVDGGVTMGMDDGADGEEGLEVYGACPGMSDVECVNDPASGYEERCRATVNGCTPSCSGDLSCPAPTSGTAVQRCEDITEDLGDGSFTFYSACILGCHSDLTCPTGMTCAQIEVGDPDEEPTVAQACTWP